MITILDKKNLRKEALHVRLKHDFKNTSAAIVQKILNSDIFKKSNNIALYMPIKNEIDITPLLNAKNKAFYLPRCTKENELEFCRFEGYKNLKENKWNILEPAGNPVNPEILDLIYIPALMANKKFYRLGYGKGFYDKFFNKSNLSAKKIIVLSKMFINNDFIEDKNDFQCDGIICE